MEHCSREAIKLLPAPSARRRTTALNGAIGFVAGLTDCFGLKPARIHGAAISPEKIQRVRGGGLAGCDAHPFAQLRFRMAFARRS